MRINFEFGDLEAFLAVKDSGSFHAAAERLGLSQSAVTRRIAKLEQALDSQLFERTTRAVKPTLAAKRLQARAEAILEDARETSRAMRDETAVFAHQRNTILTIAAIPTVVSGLILPSLNAFRAAGYHSRIRLLDLAANEVAEAVAQGEADFGICSIPMLEPGTRFETLFEDAIMLATHPDQACPDPSRTRWDDIADLPLILPARGTGNRLLIDEAMASANRPLGWTFEVGRTSTALEMASNKAGVALVPRSAAMSHAGRGLVFHRMVDPGVSRPVGLLSRVAQSDSKPLTAFKSALRLTGADFDPG